MSTSSLTDPNIIAINRRGEVTPEQREALQGAAGSFGVLGCGLAIALTALVVVTLGKWLEQNEVLGLVVIVVILVVSALVAGRITSIPMRRRLAHARAEAVRGEVVWRGKQYAAVAQGRTLKPAGSPPDLPPGHYTFYRLENSHWLLAAERMADGTQPVSPIQADVGGFGDTFQNVTPSSPSAQNFTADEIRRALADTKRFSPDDLQANRDGRLTFSQRASGCRTLLTNGILTLGALGIGVFVLLRIASGTEQKDPGGALFAGVFFIGIGLFLIVLSYPGLVDTLVGRVEVEKGVGRKGSYTIRSSRSRSRTHYYYEINGRRFEIPVVAHNAFIEGVVYRAYYTPRGKMLVNIEPDAP